MDSTGGCYENAVSEAFHATLEKELLRRHSFRTRQEARTAIFEWIEPGTTASGATPGSATARLSSSSATTKE